MSVRPSNEVLACAALAGIVFGALGAGFALAVLITAGVLGVVGVWRAVSILEDMRCRSVLPVRAGSRLLVSADDDSVSTAVLRPRPGGPRPRATPPGN